MTPSALYGNFVRDGYSQTRDEYLGKKPLSLNGTTTVGDLTVLLDQVLTIAPPGDRIPVAKRTFHLLFVGFKTLVLYYSALLHMRHSSLVDSGRFLWLFGIQCRINSPF